MCHIPSLGQVAEISPFLTKIYPNICTECAILSYQCVKTNKVKIKDINEITELK